MHKLTVGIVAIALAGPLPAFAQSSGSSAKSSSSMSADQSQQSLPTQIQNKLRDQGFTNVEVVPGSFLVSARDKQGDPVTMIIGPNSMTMFTVNTSQGSSTVGSNPQQKSTDKK